MILPVVNRFNSVKKHIKYKKIKVNVLLVVLTPVEKISLSIIYSTIEKLFIIKNGNFKIEHIRVDYKKIITV